MLRSFIAVEMPTEIQTAIAHSTGQLQETLTRPLVRWVAPRNTHLTLKFLGDVSHSNLEQLAEVLRVEAAGHEAFSLSVHGLGAFPNTRRARVIWIGLEAPPALAALQRGVEMTCARLGYLPEERPFSPHLTIGRVDQHAGTADLQRIRSALEAVSVGVLGEVRVDRIHVFKSDLQPAGPAYTPLYSLPLRAS